MSNPLFYLIYTIIGVYKFLLIIHVVMSWLIGFDIINRHSRFVQQVSDALYRLFDPALKKIRPYMPDLGSFDLSIIALFIIVQVINYTIYWAEQSFF